MRCIEMMADRLVILLTVTININMRCIEMKEAVAAAKKADRLTLTWDVLKLIVLDKRAESATGLTLTWDVLKWHDELSESLENCD